MTIPTTTAAYTDFGQLAALKGKANQDSEAALKQVAQQFESIFLGMMMKTMREASIGDQLFQSHGNDMYRDLLDKQMALEMSSGSGIGLSEMIVKQLSHSKAIVEPPQQPIEFNTALNRVHSYFPPRLASDEIPAPQAPVQSGMAITESVNFDDPESFVQSMLPMAKKAADEIGVDPRVLIAQAALETGWGKRVIQRDNGESSHNLFNIKADNRWSGDVARINTLEYKEGIPVKVSAPFRAYDSYQQSFDDYVAFVKSSPRYGDALDKSHNSEAYITELHRAGYATDPEYSNKIKEILGRDVLALADQERLKLSRARTL